MSNCSDKVKMRLLIKSYLCLKGEASAHDLSEYLNTYFKWHIDVNPRLIGKVLQYSGGVLDGLTYRYGDSNERIYYIDRNKKSDNGLRRTLQYIAETKHGFKVMKYLGGRNKYFGTYSSIEEAIRVRDYCLKYDWDEELRLRLLHDGSSVIE